MDSVKITPVINIDYLLNKRNLAKALSTLPNKDDTGLLNILSTIDLTAILLNHMMIATDDMEIALRNDAKLNEEELAEFAPEDVDEGMSADVLTHMVRKHSLEEVHNMTEYVNDTLQNVQRCAVTGVNGIEYLINICCDNDAPLNRSKCYVTKIKKPMSAIESTLYRSIKKSEYRLKHLINIGAPDYVVNIEKFLLAKRVDTYMNDR